jgi:hypothetical protein
VTALWPAPESAPTTGGGSGRSSWPTGIKPVDNDLVSIRSDLVSRPTSRRAAALTPRLPEPRCRHRPGREFIQPGAFRSGHAARAVERKISLHRIQTWVPRASSSTVSCSGGPGGGRLTLMTVELASFPGLCEWDPEQHYYYFELLGETSPVLDTSYGELAAGTGRPADGTVSTHVFEYAWTIGHLGVSQRRLRARRGAGRKAERAQAFSPVPPSDSRTFWDNLGDLAAEIYIYFPQTGGWRVSELGATVKYLTPLPEEESFVDKAARDAELMQPVISAAGQLANVAAPGAGSVISGSAHIVGALAQMKLNSVPQTQGFPWSAAKTACVWNRETMTGVAWSLPKSMFEELGGRITGTLAVIFVPVREQNPEAASSEPVDPKPRQILARAVVHGSQSIPAPPDTDDSPDRHDYLKLCITPTLPTSHE